ncbi:MAG: putative Na+/H+ antiporter, partial [Bdellovibrionota bacterium]
REPLFVFVILALCSTQPILHFAHLILERISRLLPFQRSVSFYFVTLTLGPALGSLITEPAAMTVTALILLEHFYRHGVSDRFKYATLGLLFVNISICGTLTPYAAPPILMVARAWNWDLSFMLVHFGWKGMLASILSTSIVTFRFRNEIQRIKRDRFDSFREKIPTWLQFLHLCFLAAVIVSAHHPVVFIGIFLFFLGLVSVTSEYQDFIELRQGLLVAFFLGGLVVLGTPQREWLEPLISNVTSGTLFLGSSFLTAFVDNAALTYLGSQVKDLSEASRFALVSGSVVGGGLTVIANAPNPAGFGILNSSFGKDGISPFFLFTHALFPTLIAGVCFWFL